MTDSRIQVSLPSFLEALVHYSLDVNGVKEGFNVNGGFKYFDDNLISELESLTEKIPDLKLYNFAGPINQSDALDLVGKGQGANKTTTSVYGVTVAEDFGIGDELFLHWILPPLLIRTLDPIIGFGEALRVKPLQRQRISDAQGSIFSVAFTDKRSLVGLGQFRSWADC